MSAFAQHREKKLPPPSRCHGAPPTSCHPQGATHDEASKLLCRAPCFLRLVFFEHDARWAVWMATREHRREEDKRGAGRERAREKGLVGWRYLTLSRLQESTTSSRPRTCSTASSRQVESLLFFSKGTKKLTFHTRRSWTLTRPLEWCFEDATTGRRWLSRRLGFRETTTISSSRRGPTRWPSCRSCPMSTLPASSACARKRETGLSSKVGISRIFFFFSFPLNFVLFRMGRRQRFGVRDEELSRGSPRRICRSNRSANRRRTLVFACKRNFAFESVPRKRDLQCWPHFAQAPRLRTSHIQARQFRQRKGKILMVFFFF